ncbi:hypothetical protein [Hymenobacter edaphi]|uniref:Uncharacterized protein n=1 Tax=Hymenobacter edaphi TaxID=2211146 RepID=A0A328BH81_9BACT|nr:hypothetical protein [Hymenobacter edaphi]RAK65306.1 hypothetical protein DLM85_17425 [Hymenobacter edaphi]
MDLRVLYDTLRQRRRPEDVADMLLPLLQAELTPQQRATLEKAARHSIRRSVWQYTAMQQTFRAVVGADKQAGKAAELFRVTPDPAARFDDPAAVETLLRELNPLIGKEFDHHHYEADRLNREARRAAGLDLSKRRYNKLFRSLRHLEQKLFRLLREYRKLEQEQVAKHKFAHRISYEEFARDPATAAFIAYYTARCNVRSEFTNQSQQRPYDEVAHMLFLRLTGSGLAPTTAAPNWWAVAQVYPAPEVLAQLTEAQKGELLGQWATFLTDLADFLGDIWAQNDFRATTMVVKRGDDSSTWNAAAGAWNKARDSWLNLLYALGMEFVLDELCFGKVMRLMAADVAFWHRSSGGDLDPNTAVWAELPFPWEVLAGTARCTRTQVENVCRRAGLDAYKTGWLAPRPHGVVAFQPTPELVHGVSVANPYLAAVLKRHRYFSGKPAQPLRPEDN